MARSCSSQALSVCVWVFRASACEPSVTWVNLVQYREFKKESESIVGRISFSWCFVLLVPQYLAHRAPIHKHLDPSEVGSQALSSCHCPFSAISPPLRGMKLRQSILKRAVVSEVPVSGSMYAWLSACLTY